MRKGDQTAMYKYKYTVILEIDQSVMNVEEPLRKKLLNIIRTVDILNHIHAESDEGRLNLENYYYSSVVEGIEELAPYLNHEGKGLLQRNLELLSAGEFDIINVPIISDSGTSEVLFGKIISPDNSNEKRYAAALCIPDKVNDIKIEKFDRMFVESYSKTPFCKYDKGSGNFEIQTDFRCAYAVSLAGELDRKNKPISVFYSGDRSGDLPSLSRVMLFTNLYFARFDLITSQLGLKYIRDFVHLSEIPPSSINSIILYWLRGHDLGHSVGSDNLGNNMKDQRFVYYSLHELKSDVISLYFLTRFGLPDADLQTLSNNTIFKVFTAEALRYIRRGNPDHIPDTSSAYLALNYLLKHGALQFEKSKGRFSINSGKFCDSLEELCVHLTEIFRSGDSLDANSFYQKFITPDCGIIPEIVKDSGVPYYIDLETLSI